MILLTGGSGLLGTELQKHLKCDAPPRKELDITKDINWPTNYEMIVHCAAYTDVKGAEKEPDKCYEVNFWGTFNLVNHFKNIPFVYISTEYAWNPCNVYTWSKKAAEDILRSPYMIIRTLFKPRPFPHNKAWVDQYTKGDYVDVIAPMVATKIMDWKQSNNWKVRVGSGRKTMYELARMSRPDVKKANLSKSKLGVCIPGDYK